MNLFTDYQAAHPPIPEGCVAVKSGGIFSSDCNIPEIAGKRIVEVMREGKYEYVGECTQSQIVKHWVDSSSFWLEYDDSLTKQPHMMPEYVLLRSCEVSDKAIKKEKNDDKTRTTN
jgi:hypothetical protein